MSECARGKAFIDVVWLYCFSIKRKILSKERKKERKKKRQCIRDISVSLHKSIRIYQFLTIWNPITSYFSQVFFVFDYHHHKRIIQNEHFLFQYLSFIWMMKIAIWKSANDWIFFFSAAFYFYDSIWFTISLSL